MKTIFCLLALTSALLLRPSPGPPEAREDAYRLNNLGVAFLEQYDYEKAAASFRKALAVEPGLAIARANLALALYQASDLPGALREAKDARERMPEAPQPYYLLGLIARSENRVEDALEAFGRVLTIDPRDVGTNVNLGHLYLQQRRYAEAIEAFRTALAAEPHNVTAAYNLGMALTRAGRTEEGREALERSQALRDSGYGTLFSTNYLEQGRYAEALVSTGAEAALVDVRTPEVRFVDGADALPATRKERDPDWGTAFGRRFRAGEPDEARRRELAGGLGGGVALADLDGDGDLDLCEVAPQGPRLLRNDEGRFSDVTESSGLAPWGAEAVAIGAVAGDYDNDGKPDLFVLAYPGSRLYRNEGGLRFRDVTAAAGIPVSANLALSAALVDADHDGDLDLFIAGFASLGATAAATAEGHRTFPEDFPGAPGRLLRNNGNGSFTDVTAEARLGGALKATAVAPTDFDDRRDVDLLVADYERGAVLFANRRDGTFRDMAGEVGLAARGRLLGVAAGDVNKDGFPDFFLGRAGEIGLLARSDGRGGFVVEPGPPGTEGTTAAQLVDYDNDGLLDLVAFTSSGPRVYRNLGERWVDVSAQALGSGLVEGWSGLPPPRGIAVGDLDGDGDADLVVRGPQGVQIWRNEGGGRNRSLRVLLAGRVSNRSGVGAKVEIRAGSLSQRRETSAATPAPAPADVLFGLGQRRAADVVRILWPAGIVQAETEVGEPSPRPGPLAATLAVTELDRKPSSCPFLYAWNGEGFEFVTDFMGGGEMGYWVAPGVRNVPDPDEYVRIRDDQLAVRDGRYELRVTNELEEALFVDRLRLVAIAHPSDVEVFPNEGLGAPGGGALRLYSTREARPPLSAVDGQGRDVLARIARLDRRYPDLPLRRIRGYAEEHDLVLGLPPSPSGRTLLLLTGWTDYAFSSDNVAAHQAGFSLRPPELQVRDPEGGWRTVIPNIGVPVGRPQTVAVDLSGKLPLGSREVRIRTSMRIYWDEVRVDTSGGGFPLRKTTLEPLVAELRWRGYSAEFSPDGGEPFTYDYRRVSLTSPWKAMPGRYTREGDVRELLARVDDMFVVSRPGDEIALAFDATALPRLPEGWKRTYLLFVDGFSKEMDLHSSSPDQVAPLPFHGMTRYPYSPPEAYPSSPAHRAYLERYNTRVVRASVPPLEASLLEAGRSRRESAEGE